MKEHWTRDLLSKSTYWTIFVVVPSRFRWRTFAFSLSYIRVLVSYLNVFLVVPSHLRRRTYASPKRKTQRRRSEGTTTKVRQRRRECMTTKMRRYDNVDAKVRQRRHENTTTKTWRRRREGATTKSRSNDNNKRENEYTSIRWRRCGSTRTKTRWLSLYHCRTVASSLLRRRTFAS